MLLEIPYPDLYMLTPVLNIIVMMFLLILMIYFYGRNRVFPIMLIIFLFSLIIGVNSFSVHNIPFTPYFQLFFLLIQAVFFTLTSFDLYSSVKRAGSNKKR